METKERADSNPTLLKEFEADSRVCFDATRKYQNDPGAFGQTGADRKINEPAREFDDDFDADWAGCMRSAGWTNED